MRCFRCNKSEKKTEFAPGKKSPSSICIPCFNEIKVTGSPFLHEQAKIAENDPNFDLLSDHKYMKKWNEDHPISLHTVKGYI